MINERAANGPTLPEDILQRLQMLRDLHAPDPIFWLPLAPGWWIGAGVLLVSVIAIGIWAVKRRRSVLGQALQELAAIERSAKHEGCLRSAAIEVSMLLRRYALFAFPRQQVAGLTGQRWVGFLNAAANQPLFEGEVSRTLLQAPYQPSTAQRHSAVLTLIGAARAWLRREPSP